METLYLLVKIISNSARKSTNNSLCHLFIQIEFILNDPLFIGACRAAKKIWHCNIEFKENNKNVAFFSGDFYLGHYKIQTISAIQKIQKRQYSTRLSSTTSFSLALRQNQQPTHESRWCKGCQGGQKRVSHGEKALYHGTKRREEECKSS